MDIAASGILKKVKDAVLHHVPATAIYLYGSYAYGVPNEKSDLDIMVVVPDSFREQMRTTLYPKIRHELPVPEKYMVDLKLCSSSTFNFQSRFSSFEKTIKSKGKLLYESP